MTVNKDFSNNKKLLFDVDFTDQERTAEDTNTVRRAINEIRRIFGSQSSFADALGRSPQQVQKWFSTEEIPLKWVYQIEQLTGGAVKCHEMAPGYFPVR